MTGKAKPQKHSAKELKQKEYAATVNRGGGAAGAADRAGGKAGHARYQCPICKQAAPDPKSGEAHWDARHSKAGPFDFVAWTNAHEVAGGVTTAGVAVRGGLPDKVRGVHKEALRVAAT
eukprot:NODE_3140_length_824_cov_686.530559.p2 GENE.NODE_3140_length_824_cov_686.530559~~NODE_3140_length_824_cov_686.530559.p2  ORF type:complete len:119 (+),score=36.00 NODE_3140_length_824_cov_686.530559:109-465(+)